LGPVVGAGLASGARVRWGWRSRGAAPGRSSRAGWWRRRGAAVVGALLFASMKFFILDRSEPFKRGFMAIRAYLAFTAGVLAPFLVLELPSVGALETMKAGGVLPAVAGVVAGTLIISYVFFMPYFYRRLVKKDARVKSYHVVLGPLLLKDDISRFLFFPRNPDGEVVRNYYEDSYAVRTKLRKCVY
jgi:uncharacterized membrane protein